MIWQLMKRDVTLRVLTLFAMVMLALIPAGFPYLLGDASGKAAHAAVGAVIGGMGWVAIISLSTQGYSAQFEGALPIHGRYLWLSQILWLLLLIWLPLTASACFINPQLPLFAAGAVYTTLILGAKCFRIQELGVSRRVRSAGLRIFFGALFGATIFSRQLKSIQWPAPPSAGIVLLVCGFASAALFWWGWTNVPKSFQVAPLDSLQALPALRPETRVALGFTGLPVFRSIYDRSMLFVVAFLVYNIFAGWLWAASLLIGLTQVSLRGQCRWLLALPFSPRRLFAWIALPQTAAIVAACLAVPFIATKQPLSPRAVLVEMAAELAILYGLIFLSELTAWRRLSRLRAAPLGTWILWTPFVLGAFAPIFAFSKIVEFERFAKSLPENWWQLAALLTLPVIATYWLAEKAFREQEYRQLLIELPQYRRN